MTSPYLSSPKLLFSSLSVIDDDPRDDLLFCIRKSFTMYCTLYVAGKINHAVHSNYNDVVHLRVLHGKTNAIKSSLFGDVDIDTHDFC